jgi:hypothetical protein
MSDVEHVREFIWDVRIAEIDFHSVDSVMRARESKA